MTDLTKGPWHWRNAGLDHRGEGRKLILEGIDGRTVCDFGEVRGDWGGESSGEEPFGVDAKLIEAGYDLLAALVAARREMTNTRYDKPRIGMEATCAIVDAAYLKATGEEWPYGSHEILSTLKIAEEEKEPDPSKCLACDCQIDPETTSGMCDPCHEYAKGCQDAMDC